MKGCIPAPALALCLAVAACATAPAPAPEPITRTVEIKVPVQVPCPALEKLGAEPIYPDTDTALKAAPNLYERVKLLMAGRVLRIARRSRRRSRAGVMWAGVMKLWRSSISGRFRRAPRGLFAWIVKLFSVRETRP